MISGLLLVTYAAAIVTWRDPVTDLYARWQQHQLAATLDDSFRAFTASAEATEPLVPRNPAQPPSAEELAASRRSVEASARRIRSGLERSDPLGRIVIPRLGIDPVFVHGTRWKDDLSKGPGHYEQTALPGLGKTVAIAGHRTTFGAPFRHIDRLEARDEIVLETAYATFRYRVVGHEIVEDDDWTIIRPRPFETLVLSACHPLFRASHRWVVYARLAEVAPTRGIPYRLASNGRLRASTTSLARG
jgi:sortase A